MIAIDTNILVYAHREDSGWHQPARRAMTPLVEGTAAWAIPWPCIHEFLAIVTSPRIFKPPTALQTALAQVEALLGSPSIVLLSEEGPYWPVFKRAIEAGKIVGPTVHDARIAALCMHHGVRELWTADRDFARFPGITVRNPLIG